MPHSHATLENSWFRSILILSLVLPLCLLILPTASSNHANPSASSACPTVDGMNPTHGNIGTSVLIGGTSFTDVSAAKFGNVEATFIINSDTRMTVIVPAGAPTGPITISKNGCSDVQTPSFKVTPPPTATTLDASAITSTTATLNGIVNPKGSDAEAWFQYGTDSNKLSNPTYVHYLGDGTTDVHIETALSGLTPNTTYYFGVLAYNTMFNTGLSGYGAVKSFTTQPGCTYSLDHYTQAFPASGGTDIIRVTYPTGCPLSEGNEGWIINIISTSGTNTGTLTYTVQPTNLNTRREGRIIFGEYQVFKVVQAGLNENQIDYADVFVRQHYLDFLNREPDQGGWDYWTGQITQCGTDQSCINSRRVGVSAAYFMETEFQDTGSYVYRLYKASYGQNPAYSQFTQDRNQVVVGSNLEASKQALAEAFVQRGDFIAKYATTLNGSDFITALINTVKQGSGVDLTSHSNELLSEYNAGANQTNSRARVLRKLIEYLEFKNAEYNRAFVLMQYFGYLRRDADTGGYNFWLDVLNNKLPNDNSGYRSMVCAFLTSTEYQHRFSPVATRNDHICGSINQ